MQNHKKIFARKKDNVNFTQSTNLVNLKKKNMDMTLSGLNPTLKCKTLLLISFPSAYIVKR